MKHLEPIPFPGFANRKSWEGYPRQCLQHPERNRPETMSWLIQKYSYPCDIVFDPMAGIGTVMHEADKLMRFGRGEEINPLWREMWWVPSWAEAIDDRCTPALIVTSPSYLGNHAPGNTAAQRQYQEQAGSVAGNHMPGSKIKGALGDLDDEGEFWAELRNIYERCYRLLTPGGVMVVIVRDRIVKGESNNFVRDNWEVMIGSHFNVIGAHPRKLIPGFRYQQRAKLRQSKGVVEAEPFIDTEWAIVGVKKDDSKLCGVCQDFAA